MKYRIFCLLSVFLASAFITVNAQGGQRLSVEERVNRVMEKISSFNLDDAKKTEVDSIFTQSYRALDAKRSEIRNNSEGGEQRAEMREEMRKITAERDEKLKKIFTEEQYKKWKEEIEPSMRPQRRN